MKNRTLVKDLKNNVGNYVNLAGWLSRIRDQKKMQFLVLRDHTGLAQACNEKNGKDLDNIISSVREESAVTLGGKVILNDYVKLNGLEIQLDYLNVQGPCAGPIPINKDSNIDSRLDWRYLDLRDPKKLLIFKIQTTAEQAMREWWINNGFLEIHSPKLVEGASESGAELFKLDYFGKSASLAQSPQFYKQMAMTAGFDKVFEIGPVFRANPSFTSRHDTEFTSVDMELSWVDSHEEVMEAEEKWLNYTLSRIKEKHGEDIKSAYGVDVKVPSLPFPRVTMNEAYKILEGQGYVVPREEKGDLNPEGEKRLYNHFKEKFDHEFLFVTDYPAKSRAFYHMRFDDRPDITKSFDLLWKGMEVTTGAQREHRYDRLIKQAQEKGVDIKSISSYIDFFKYGAPSHGGCGFGLTRMLMNLTGLSNVREVTFVYRGPNRITP
jgi:nondiscriminating aspartyl-tRNA synthetase